MVAYFAPLRRLLVFNAEHPDRAARGSIHGDKGYFIGKKQRRREAEFLPCRACRGRFAQPRKRVAARGYARARRAVDGFACEHASALGPASAMRCIAATRHGSPLRGTRKFTENPMFACANPYGSLQAFFRGVQCRAKPVSVSAGCGGDATHREGRGMAVAMLAWTGAIPCP